jgi:hypothetical protein
MIVCTSHDYNIYKWGTYNHLDYNMYKWGTYNHLDYNIYKWGTYNHLDYNMYMWGTYNHLDYNMYKWGTYNHLDYNIFPIAQLQSDQRNRESDNIRMSLSLVGELEKIRNRQKEITRQIHRVCTSHVHIVI